VQEPASADSLGDPDSGQEPPAAPRVLPGQRLGAALEVLLCSGFPTQILLIGILTGLGMPMHAAPERLSPVFVFALSLLDTVLVVGLVLFFISAHRESPREMFLDRRPILREALVGVSVLPLLIMLVLLVRALIYTFAPQLHNVERNPFEDMMQTPVDAAAFGVVVMVAGGVREEIQRAFILRRFQQYLGGAVSGIVIFSTLFGLGHIEQGTDAALATALLGATWGVVYFLRSSIVAPMVSHAAFNLTQLLTYLTFS
jgi:membrane protease YdiL (CAAX protease family)